MRSKWQEGGTKGQSREQERKRDAGRKQNGKNMLPWAALPFVYPCFVSCKYCQMREAVRLEAPGSPSKRRKAV